MAYTKNLENAGDWTALILIIIGALNWGLLGIFDFNLVEAILGGFPTFVRIVYTLVGFSAVYAIVRMLPGND